MLLGPLGSPAPVARMGREKTILLGFLGLLAGVFVGALSLKLLVPRPPTGAGPDIRTDVGAVTPQARVEPPEPTPGGWDFAAAPPLVPDAPAAPPPAAPPTDTPTEPTRFGRFPPPQADDAAALGPPHADGDVTPASWQHAVPQTDQPDAVAAGGPVRDAFVAPPATARAVPVAGDYLVQAGDSWWDVAERAYGDGRLYRALFAWNRSRDPRVTLAPGTRLDVPPLDRLEAAWPRLTSPSGPR